MLSFSDISIDDQEKFKEYILKYGAEASDINFTTIYMWAEALGTKYTEIGNFICNVARPMKFDPYILPPFGGMNDGDYEKAIKELKSYFDSRGWKLMGRRFVKKDIEMLRLIGDIKFEAVYTHDISDYIYRREDLVSLKGKKYHAKRNHISRFLRDNDGAYEYLPMAREHIDDCVELAGIYCSARGGECIDCDVCEKNATQRVLKKYDELGCSGGVVKLDGSIKAFTLGEMLNEDTAVTHIEKADKQIKGLYTFINQQFNTHGLPSEAIYINREEDMGLEGLRKAKQSYHPLRMEEKYLVYFE